jgi:excisionase family DNA binding protein
MIEGYLTISEVAEKVGVSSGRIRQLVAENKLPSVKVGKSNLIKESDLALVTIHGKAGRPKKNTKA